MKVNLIFAVGHKGPLFQFDRSDPQYHAGWFNYLQLAVKKAKRCHEV